MADAPKVVWVPIFFPLGGVGRSPQEMTAMRLGDLKEGDAEGVEMIEWDTREQGTKRRLVGFHFENQREDTVIYSHLSNQCDKSVTCTISLRG